MVCIEYREGSMFYKETAVGPTYSRSKSCWTDHKHSV